MSNKSYLDYFLDNEIEKDNKKTKKKKKWDFNETHEEAIVLLLSKTLSKKEEEILWKEVVYPSFKTIVNGVLQMKIFHFLPKNLDREILIEDTILRLIEKLEKFTPGLIGKSGKPVKAFSFLSTVAKHYILEKKFRAKKIIENKADVETSIDLQILSEEILERISGVTSVEDKQNDSFETIRKKIIKKIEKIILSQKNHETDFVKVGFVLIYLFKNWDSIELDKKNNFMKMLVLYTGLKQSTVSNIFKNYKLQLMNDGLANLVLINDKLKTKNVFKKEKDLDNLDELDELDEFEIEDESDSKAKKKEERYIFKTLEEFERNL